jgi:hypothetical protein
MWHQQLFAPRSICEEFENFLEQLTEDQDTRRVFYQGESPCLLDLVAAWVAFKDTILWFPSYDVFMAGLVVIIEAWLNGDKKQINSFPLWHDPQTGIDQVVEHLLPRNERGTHYEHDFEVGIAHVLLNPSAFNAQKERALQAQQHAIQLHLERLLPNESS